MKKNKPLIITLTLLIIASLVFYFFYYKKTPSYTIMQIVTSIKNKDEQTFNKYVDLNSVVYFSIDEIIDQQTKEMTTEESAMIKSFAKFFQKPLAEKLAGHARENLFNKQSKPTTSQQTKENSLFKNLENKLKPNKLSFKTIGNSQISAQDAKVDITLLDEKLQKEFVFTAHMKKLDDGTWKLVKITNTAPYFQQLIEDKSKTQI